MCVCRWCMCGRMWWGYVYVCVRDVWWEYVYVWTCVGVATFTSTLELDANFLIEELSKLRAH